MPHQNIFRCHIKRPGPRAGTKTAAPVGRARTPASPPFATNRTVTIPAILSSRAQAKAPCVHLRSITPCQASRIATAELRRQASLTLAFRPVVGGLEPRPPHSVSSARLGRRGLPSQQSAMLLHLSVSDRINRIHRMLVMPADQISRQNPTSQSRKSCLTNDFLLRRIAQRPPPAISCLRLCREEDLPQCD